jgi:hypothetical protein
MAEVDIYAIENVAQAIRNAGYALNQEQSQFNISNLDSYVKEIQQDAIFRSASINA